MPAAAPGAFLPSAVDLQALRAGAAPCAEAQIWLHLTLTALQNRACDLQALHADATAQMSGAKATTGWSIAFAATAVLQLRSDES